MCVDHLDVSTPSRGIADTFCWLLNVKKEWACKESNNQSNLYVLNHEGGWCQPCGMHPLSLAVSWPPSVVLLFPGRERNVRRWEAWSPHVCVWVDGSLYQYPPLPQWPAEAGYPVRCDCPSGGQGVPWAPGRTGRLQRVFPPGAGGPAREWLGC